MRLVGERIARLDGELREVESQLNDLLAGLPNYPYLAPRSVPVKKV